MDCRLPLNVRGMLIAIFALTLLTACGPAEDEAPWLSPPPTPEAGLEIWFIRHAESEINVLTGPPPVPDDGISYPLTARGVEQAAALGERMADQPVTALYASTRLRTLQTANAISLQTGQPLRLAPELVEVHLDITGDHPEDFDIDAFFARWAAGEHDLRAGSGESLNDLRQRVQDFWGHFVARHRDDGGLVPVVTHGGVMMFTLPVLCDNDVPMGFTLQQSVSNTGIVKAWLGEDGHLHCYEWDGVPIPD